MDNLLVQFAVLGGASAFIAAFVSFAKAWGAIRDGESSTWSTVIGTFLFSLFVYAKLFRPDLDIAYLDGILLEASKVMLYALGLSLQLGLPSLFYRLWKEGKVPLLGYSFPKPKG